MKPAGPLVAAVLVLVLVVSASVAAAERLALVVGNDAYSDLSVLRNAVNDARAVAVALEDVGFTVTKVENATRAEMATALGRFAARVQGDDVALFYFAGHGVQVNQTNYLIPTDYSGQTAAEVQLSAFSAVEIEGLLREARVAMLVFDACRNNPYRGFRTSGGGLAAMEARGTLIAYAAGAGEVAVDAAPGASNGLFTAKLVEALRVPGLTATELFQRVRRQVYAASNEEQFPAVYDQLLSDFVFRPPAGPGPRDPVPAAALTQQENLFWDSIRDSTTPADFEAYKRRFPGGVFEELADNRLAALTAGDRPSRPRPPAPVPDPVTAVPAGRVALVVGNGAYARSGRLPTPGNDAADMSAALRRLGFDVTTVRDADRRALIDALRVLTRASARADVSLVFYAGHGFEMDDVNYLIPVDARLERDTDVRFEAIELNHVLEATVGADLRVVILDASRNNPLGDLDTSLLGDETVVAYSAAAGTTADDGTGRNSPYTAALLSYLEQPLEIGRLFREVRTRVQRATGGRQLPHMYHTLLGEHYLRAPVGLAPRAVEESLELNPSTRRLIQQGLAAAGFAPGPADGVFSVATREAILSWQTSRGEAGTGWLDAAAAATLTRLGRAAERRRAAEELQRAEEERRRRRGGAGTLR